MRYFGLLKLLAFPIFLPFTNSTNTSLPALSGRPVVVEPYPVAAEEP
jgi:hypothetical protein